MKLNKEDLIWCLRRLPKSVFNYMEEKGPEITLAGGYIRSCITGEPINDIDLFTKDITTAEVASLRLSLKEHRVSKTDNAYTIVRRGAPAIQIIHRWTYEKPEDIVPSFDFTIARAAIWYDGSAWTSMCDEHYYEDIAAKRLRYCSPIRNEDAGGSMLRVLKFYQKGYRIPLDSLGAVISRLFQGVEPKGDGGWDAIIDDEKYRTKILTGLLREVDPDIDPIHRAHLPSSDDAQPREDIL